MPRRAATGTAKKVDEAYKLIRAMEEKYGCRRFEHPGEVKAENLPSSMLGHHVSELYMAYRAVHSALGRIP